MMPAKSVSESKAVMAVIKSALKQKLALVGAMVFLAFLLSGCQPVQAWERGILAKPEMAINPDPLESTLNNHIYFSKEASNGGHSATGGGCGCN